MDQPSVVRSAPTEKGEEQLHRISKPSMACGLMTALAATNAFAAHVGNTTSRQTVTIERIRLSGQRLHSVRLVFS